MFCARLSKWMFHVVVLLCSTATYTAGRRSPESVNQDSEGGNVSEAAIRWPMDVKLWTWNSGKTDLEQEAKKLFNDNIQGVDMIVTCQTEAKRPIRDFVKDDSWLLISHSEHKGVTAKGGLMPDFNSQIISVFYRHPSDQRLKANVTWKPKGRWLTMQDHVVMEKATIPGVVTATSQVHSTSRTGKGGAIADLLWSDGFRQSFVCAHLDSNGDGAREEGLKFLLREVLNLAGSVVLLGDLNFRLRMKSLPISQDAPSTDLAQDIMKMFTSAGGRQALSLADPLKTVGPETNFLITQFGFRCNQPYLEYPPTYKLVDVAACSSPFMSNSIDWYLKCYASLKVDKNASKTKVHPEQEVKKIYKVKMMNEGDARELKLGWLDRICYQNNEHSRLIVEELSQAGWIGWAGSDHMAIETTVRVAARSAQ